MSCAAGRAWRPCSRASLLLRAGGHEALLGHCPCSAMVLPAASCIPPALPGCGWHCCLLMLLPLLLLILLLQIPGGPKLTRTPVGRTPATGGGYHHGPGAPGSAVAQHYPGSARAVHFAAGPSSTSMQRYPGSAVAPHRGGGGGLTPQQQFAPPPMTFQVLLGGGAGLLGCCADGLEAGAMSCIVTTVI